MTANCRPPIRRTEHNGPIDDDHDPEPAERTLERARDRALVEQVRAGDADAFGTLYDTWFDRVHRVIRRIVHDDEIAAEVTQDTFLAAWRSLPGLHDPASFGGWLLRIGRNAALNRAAREGRSTAIDDAQFAMIEQQGASSQAAPAGFSVADQLAGIDDPAVAAGNAQIVAMVREAAAALGPRDAEVLDLQLSYRLSPAEVGQVLDLNRNAANQLCHRVRNRFAGAFGARMLWADGSPRCPVLRSELAEGGVERFGHDAVPIISRHAEGCERCGEDRRTRLDPSVLFASIPIVPALWAVKSGVAHGLSSAGVPMGGSAVFAPTANPTGGEGATTPGSLGSGPRSPDDPSPRMSPEGSSRRLLVSALIGIAAVALIIVAVVAFGPRQDSERRLAAGSTSTLPGNRPGTEATTRPGSTDGGSPSPSVAPMPPPSNGPGSTSAPSSTVATTTTTVPSPSVDRFTVAPSTPQPAVWATADGPVLSWSVRNASDVSIVLWFDDGTHGEQRVGVVATGASGSMPLCPGSHPTPTSCTASSGRYRYELQATGSDGTPFVAPDSPGFDVLQPVIN